MTALGINQQLQTEVVVHSITAEMFDLGLGFSLDLEALQDVLSIRMGGAICVGKQKRVLR